MNTFTYNPDYQAGIAATITNALQTHNRVTAIRVDLRLPNNFGGIDASNSIITRFFESLKAKLAVDLKHKNKDWGRNHTCILKYVWVREVGHLNGKMHFHILLLLNKDVYYSLGDFKDASGNLSAMIRQAWCSALGLSYPGFQQLVHFPERGVMHMDKNSSEFIQQLQIVLERTDYLAKELTKQYGVGQRSFGCSR